MKRASISAVVLTKNEEVNIRRCLESVKWADDLIVVDGGSTDSTLDIAKSFGARVFVHIPKVYYASDERNWALDNTGITTEWVLFIDADEVIPEKLREAILEEIASAPPEVVGYKLCPKFIFLGRWLKHCCEFPTWHDRILRFGRVRYDPNRKFWEAFEVKPGDVVRKIFEPYLHFGFNKGINAWIDKHQRYAEWQAEWILNYSSFQFWDIVKSLFQKGKLERDRVLEILGFKMGVLSPLLRFLYHYFLKKGFLDGRAGLVYSLMLSMFQFMVYLQILEKQRHRRGLTL